MFFYAPCVEYFILPVATHGHHPSGVKNLNIHSFSIVCDIITNKKEKEKKIGRLNF
jgi:hypothetical protein